MPGATSPAQNGVLLPLFPLGIVAFPGELVFLHIFEPRYRQLIADCQRDGVRFGIVTLVTGGASSIGTEMQLERVVSADASGKMNVAVRGRRAFELKSFAGVMDGKLYSGGLVSYKANDSRFDERAQDKLVALFNRRVERTGSSQKVSAAIPQNLSFVIGHDVGLSRAQELQLLTMAAERDRQAYLTSHLERSV